MVQIIKTNVKFQKNENGQFYGFVSKNSNGSWRGCRENSGEKKKIVFADEALCKTMSENTLYHVSLVPMRNGKHGFIAMSAEPVKFVGKIETEIDNNTFRVAVKFGHKTLIYDPKSKNEKNSNIQAIANIIRNRQDLEHNYQVAEEFIDCACMALNLYKRSN